MLAEERSDTSDEAGFVLMLREQQVTLDRDVDPEPIDQGDARLTLHERPGDLGSADAHGKERGVADGLGVAPFLDGEPAQACDREGVHEIHALRAERLEQALHDGGAQWFGIQLEQLSGVCDLELRGTLVEELCDQSADALAAAQPRAATSLVRRRTRRVHRVAGRAAIEHVEDLPDDVDGDVHLRLGRRAGDVRREDRARGGANG